MPSRRSKSSDPTKRPSHHGPVALEVMGLRNMLIAKGIDEKVLDKEFDRAVANAFKHVFDLGGKMSSETNRVRELEDEVRDRDLRISALEFEIKKAHKALNEALRAKR